MAVKKTGIAVLLLIFVSFSLFSFSECDIESEGYLFHYYFADDDADFASILRHLDLQAAINSLPWKAYEMGDKPGDIALNDEYTKRKAVYAVTQANEYGLVITVLYRKIRDVFYCVVLMGNIPMGL